jgi:hypothetical protein
MIKLLPHIHFLETTHFRETCCLFYSYSGAVKFIQFETDFQGSIFVSQKRITECQHSIFNSSAQNNATDEMGSYFRALDNY